MKTLTTPDTFPEDIPLSPKVAHEEGLKMVKPEDDASYKALARKINEIMSRGGPSSD